MDNVRIALLVSILLALVFHVESESAANDGVQVVDEGAPGGDALQGMVHWMTLLQKEMRREWQDALRLLEQRMQLDTSRRNDEMKKRVEGLERRIENLETRVSVFEQGKLESAGMGEEVDRLEGRLSRLEDCMQSTLEECSRVGTPPTPASTSIPSITNSSKTSSTSSTLSPISFYTSLINTTAFRSSASGPSSRSVPSPLEAFIPQPSAASAASHPADLARRLAMGVKLINAAWNGTLNEVERLLDAGADPSYTRKDGWTPLMAASGKGHASVVYLLLRRGADVHASVSGTTALHFAAWGDRSGRCLEMLVAAGAKVDAREKCGRTPLHTAADFDNEAAARVLVAAGASLTLENDNGNTPLDQAKSDAVRALLRH